MASGASKRAFASAFEFDRMLMSDMNQILSLFCHNRELLSILIDKFKVNTAVIEWADRQSARIGRRPKADDVWKAQLVSDHAEDS